MEVDMKVVFSPVFKLHKSPYSHPEAPDRLDAVLKGAEEAGAAVQVPRAREDVWNLVSLAHERGYIELVKRLCKEDYAQIDGDTYVSSGTCDAAALAVSAVADAVDAGETVLLAVRPPGHHAGFVGRALTAPTQGFCIFNTAAIGALYKGEAVAVVDIDVHHGNGTQEILYDKDLLYISTHQHPATLYPGTGYPDEVGTGKGEGFNVNIPLPPLTGDDAYAEAVEEVVEPILRQYDPKVIIVSLGWDAHRDDPLANMGLTINGYLRAISTILRLQKPTIFLLEGGYNRDVLRRGTATLIRLVDKGEEAAGEAPSKTDAKVYERFRRELGEVKRRVSKYWRL